MKKYIKPVAEVVEIEAEELICASITQGDPMSDIIEAELNDRFNFEQEFIEMENMIKLW